MPDPAQPKNPLHGLTLAALLETLLARYGWEGLAARIDVACFKSDPSVASSLKFLRRTPWARAKVERLYLADRSAAERSRRRAERRARAAERSTAERPAAEAPGDPAPD